MGSYGTMGVLGGSGFFWARAPRNRWLGLVSSSPAVYLPLAGSGLSLPVKEEEKQKLLQRGSELQTEHQQLEERDRQLASAVKVNTGVGLGWGLVIHTQTQGDCSLTSFAQCAHRFRVQLSCGP